MIITKHKTKTPVSYHACGAAMYKDLEGKEHCPRCETLRTTPCRLCHGQGYLFMHGDIMDCVCRSKK